MDWLFVDDSREDRDSFADALRDQQGFSVAAISATEARERLGDVSLAAAGILMDIDLSNESTSRDTGLGLTADIRAAQHRQAIKSFPIVRFAYRDKVAQNIGRDTSSDQYFDLKVDKDCLDVEQVRGKLIGVTSVYAAIGADPSEFLFDLDAERWELFGSSALMEQLRVADREYVRARLVVQLLTYPGPLISEELLASRLGVDLGSVGWPALRDALAEARYTGVAAAEFPRWWARGVEAWWADKAAADAPLAATAIADRHRVLAAQFDDLTAMTMPNGSPGDRPWRACALTQEETGQFLPLDPARAVRFSIRPSAPDWLDPTYAALGPALRHKEDPRLNAGDMKRLKVLIKSS